MQLSELLDCVSGHSQVQRIAVLLLEKCAYRLTPVPFWRRKFTWSASKLLKTQMLILEANLPFFLQSEKGVPRGCGDSRIRDGGFGVHHDCQLYFRHSRTPGILIQPVNSW